MKQGKQNNSWQACTLGIIGFLLVGYMFNLALDHGQLGSMAVVLEGLTILFAFVMGYMYFEEEWNFNKTIAVALSFVAIAIIYVEESKERGITIL
jgi:multidrug transporter EmrE-like cation transporter